MDNLTQLNPEQNSLSQDHLLQPSCQEAYRLCLMYEGQFAADDDKRWIRILACLLLYAHKDGARVYLANTIMCMKDEPAILVKLGQTFEQYVIFPCEFSLFPSWWWPFFSVDWCLFLSFFFFCSQDMQRSNIKYQQSSIDTISWRIFASWYIGSPQKSHRGERACEPLVSLLSSLSVFTDLATGLSSRSWEMYRHRLLDFPWCYRRPP